MKSAEWLLRQFEKKNTGDYRRDRLRLSNMSSMTGIACNILLFVMKLAVGLAAGSLAVVSDSFNNLTDSVSNIISLIGTRVAMRPADQKHPFGHGRAEYIASFILTVLIFVTAAGFMKASIERIIAPVPVRMSSLMIVFLAAGIALKLWMSGFYRKAGEKTGNTTLTAAAEDSRNDAAVTMVSALAVCASAAGISFPFDGIAGVIVSGFIFWSGISIARTITDRILGSPSEWETEEKLRSIILTDTRILGVHDLILHDYGPGVCIGSGHAEIDGRLPFIEAHAIADEAERRVAEQMHIQLTLHMDPVETDPRALAYRNRCLQAVQACDVSVTMHDYHMRETEEEIILYFDLILPYEPACTKEEIQKAVADAFADSPIPVRAVIGYDQGFLREDVL